MSLITLPNTIASGDADNPTRDMANWTTIRDIINGNLDNTNLSATAAIAISKTALGTFTDWTTFAPTWTTSGTAPAIGNGTLTGRYCQIGKLVMVNYYFLAGTTTTFGTGTWSFTYPVAISTSNQIWTGTVEIYDDDVGWHKAIVDPATNTTINIAMGTGGTAVVTNTVPFTWDAGDFFRISFSFEAA